MLAIGVKDNVSPTCKLFIVIVALVQIESVTGVVIIKFWATDIALPPAIKFGAFAGVVSTGGFGTILMEIGVS